MVTHFFQLLHSLSQIRIKHSTMFPQIIIFYFTTRCQQRLALFSLRKWKKHLCNFIHGSSHCPIHIFLGHNYIFISTLLQCQCPRLSHLLCRIPKCTVHIKNNSFFHLHSSFTFFYTLINVICNGLISLCIWMNPIRKPLTVIFCQLVKINISHIHLF